MTQLQNFIKSSKFQSLKQEETMALQKGKRCMLDTSTALNSSEYLEKKLDINVKSFLTKCYEAKTSYLKTLTNTNYYLKGHTCYSKKGKQFIKLYLWMIKTNAHVINNCIILGILNVCNRTQNVHILMTEPFWFSQIAYAILGS